MFLLRKISNNFGGKSFIILNAYTTVIHQNEIPAIELHNIFNGLHPITGGKLK